MCDLMVTNAAFRSVCYSLLGFPYFKDVFSNGLKYSISLLFPLAIKHTLL